MYIRRLDAASDGEVVRELFNRTFGERISKEEYDWKYVAAPDGPMHVFAAQDPESGRIAGIFSCAPRGYWSAGEIVVVYQEADAAVDPAFRGRGVFSMLVNAVTRHVVESGGLFHYGFTNEASAGAMRRIPGVFENFGNQVFVFPLGARNIVEQFAALPRGARRGVASVGTPIMRLRARLSVSIRRGSAGPQMQPVQAFDDYPEELAREWSRHYALVPRRTKAFLDWRTREVAQTHLEHLRAFWLQRGGTRIGYVVLYHEQRRNVLKIIDLMCEPDVTSLTACLNSLLRFALDEGVDAVSTNMAGRVHHEGLRGAGFLARNRVRCTMFGGKTSVPYADLEERSWYLAPIDRDTFGGY